MIRILSALVLLSLVIGSVWFLPSWQLLVVAEIVLVLAFVRVRGSHGAARYADRKGGVGDGGGAELRGHGRSGRPARRRPAGRDDRPRVRFADRRSAEAGPAARAGRRLVSLAVPGTASRGAGGPPRVRRARGRAAARGDRGRERYRAVLHRFASRPHAPGAGDQPEENGRGGRRRIRVRHGDACRRRRVVASGRRLAVARRRWAPLSSRRACSEICSSRC